MTIIPPILLTLLGMGINGQYFRLHFLQGGYGPGLSVVMAAAFIGFESYLWFKTGRYAWIKIPMVAFSILVTLSSQFSSTSAVQMETVAAVNDAAGLDADIKRYESELANATKQLDAINRARTEDYMFTRTDDDLEYYRAEKARYEALLSDARSANVKHAESEMTATIYDWFAVDLPAIASQGVTPELIRVLFQLFSAFVLALMAPICFSILRERESVVKPEPEPTPEPVKKGPDYSDLVQRWVSYHWVNIRTGRGDKLLSKDMFDKALERRGVEFPEAAYQAIFLAAKRTKVIDKDTITCRIESEAVSRIKGGL